jgi:hypothetical protein
MRINDLAIVISSKSTVSRAQILNHSCMSFPHSFLFLHKMKDDDCCSLIHFGGLFLSFFSFIRSFLCRSIDAYRFGNVSRFVNHSCEANLISVPVCVEVSDETLHHVSLFAKRKICEGEELTLDYHYQINDRSVPCLCGAPNCRQWLR